MANFNLTTLLREKSIADKFKLDIRLIPNGIETIVHNDETISALQFSTAIMLVNSNSEADTFELTYEILKETGLFIHEIIKSGEHLMKLFIAGKEIPYLIHPTNFNPFMVTPNRTVIDENKNGWLPFFNKKEEHRKTIKLLPFKDLQSDRQAPENARNLIFTDSFSNEINKRNLESTHPYQQIDEQAIVDNLLEIESRLDEINKQSENITLYTKKGDATQVERTYEVQNKPTPQYLNDFNDPNVIDFNDIMTKIFTHGNIGRDRYGVIAEILVPLKSIPSSIIDTNNNLNACLAFKSTQSELVDTIFPGDDGEFERFTINGVEYSIANKVYRDYRIVKKNVDGKEKWYHGQVNYGLITNKILSEKIEWKNRSRLNSLNSKYSSVKNATSTEGFFERISKKNPNYTRGIILKHKLPSGKFEEIFQPDGVIGHNILVKKSAKEFIISTKVSSLNIHEAEFNSQQFDDAKYIEEGYLSFDAVNSVFKFNANKQITGEEEHLSTDLWNWKGKNLSVPDITVGLDINEEENTDDEAYVYDEEFDKFFKKYGFTHSMKEVKDTNISLTKDHNYSFVIREVLACNGYVFPYKSKTDKELAFGDLKTSEKENYFLNYQQEKYLLTEDSEVKDKPEPFELLLKKNPIQPPNLVPLKVFEKVEDAENSKIDNVQSTYDIFLVENDSTQEKLDSIRYIFPPQSTLQFHELSGELEQNNQNDQKFRARILNKLLKSYAKIPVVYNGDNEINYLSDPRVQYILIAPNNWKTRNNISATKIVYDLKASKLKNQAIKLVTIESSNNTFNAKLADNQLILELPKSFDGEFRMHTFSEAPLSYYKDIGSLMKLRYENPFKTLYATHANKLPQTPKLIGNHEIKASRFEVSNTSKYGTYIFAKFKANQDIGRKTLALMSQSDQIIDTGVNTPNLDENHRDDNTFFDKEYKAEVFKQTIGDINQFVEEDVYPNSFGLQINLPYAGLNLLEKGDTICKFKINDAFSIRVQLIKRKTHRFVAPRPDIQIPTRRIINPYDPDFNPWIDPWVSNDINHNFKHFKSHQKQEKTHKENAYNNYFDRSVSVFDFSVILVNDTNGVERKLFSKMHELDNADLPEYQSTRNDYDLGDLTWSREDSNIANQFRDYILRQKSHKKIDLQDCGFFFEYSHSYKTPVLNIYYSDFFNNSHKTNIEVKKFVKCFYEGEDNFFDIIGLPNKDIYQDNCSLNKDIEEFLIYNDIDYKFGVCQFTYANMLTHINSEIDTKAHSYFIFRNENDTKYKKKTIRLRASNKFGHKFPSIPFKEKVTYSRIDDTYYLTIPNAKPPKTPSIRITPLLHQFDTNTPKGIDGKQFYRLMVEVDRPWSEDELALVFGRTYKKIQENQEEVTIKHVDSDLGIDITVKNIERFDDDYGIHQYIITSPSANPYFGEQKYLKKYIGKYENIVANNVKYDIFRFKLTYYAQKNKWIAVLGFDNFNAVEDPFIKLTFARYQENSQTIWSAKTQGIPVKNQHLRISPITAPYFVHMLSDRFVSVEKATLENHIKISVSNTKQATKTHNIFLACLLDDPIATEENEIASASNNYKKWTVLNEISESDPNDNLIKYEDLDQSIFICEIQNFDDLDTLKFIEEIQNHEVDIFSISEVKIIFMREILIADIIDN